MARSCEIAPLKVSLRSCCFLWDPPRGKWLIDVDRKKKRKKSNTGTLALSRVVQNTEKKITEGFL